MKQNKTVILLLYLFFVVFFDIVSMEEKSKLRNIPMLLGYSPVEIKSNKDKQNEYLKKVQLLASLFLFQESLRKQVAVLNNTTNIIQDVLENTFYRTGFEYTDRPCKIEQIVQGSLIFFKDGERESKLVPLKYVLSTPDAKAAYLQAKSLLKTKNLELSDRLSKMMYGELDVLEHTHSKLIPFIQTLLASDNKELVDLGRWLQYIQAVEQKNKQLMLIGSSLGEVILHHYPFYFKDKNIDHAFKSFASKIEQIIEPVLGFVDNYLPTLKGFFSVNKDHLELMENCLKKGALDYDNEKFRAIFKDTYETANNNLEEDRAWYCALKKELDAHMHDKQNKNRLELLKKYSRPLYPDEFAEKVFPEELPVDFLIQNSLSVVSHDEWISNAKISEQKRKNVSRMHQHNQKIRKKTYRHAHQKQVHGCEKIKKGETEVRQEKVSEKKCVLKSLSLQKLPKIRYDYRILRWFDQDFLAERNPDERSVMYHTLPFIVNQLNKRFGVQVKQPNRTYPHKIDTVYYTGGEIHYKKGEKSGKRETVLFALCEDDQGIAYHVGWNPKQDSLFQEFETHEFNYQFPSLYDDVVYQMKTVVIDVNDEQQKTSFRESQYCYEVDYPRFGVTLILYKSAHA